MLLEMPNLDFLKTLLFLVFCSLASFASSLDTLKQGELLTSSSSKLVSANNLFVLGFYSPDHPISSNYYLAIWFNNNLDSNTPVWIGNRNTPIRGNLALLSLDSFGNLVIKGNGSAESNSFKLYSSGRQTSFNATARLSGTGNFQVRETNSNGSAGQLLWQSFDYPTDTLLPGMKLGVNHRTGHNWTLTSWFDKTDPRYGAFSLEWDARKQQLVVRLRGVISWTSGDINISLFGRQTGDYQIFNETNTDEEYFYYKVLQTSPFNASGWLLDPEGQFYDPKSGNTFAKLDYCYGFKYTTFLEAPPYADGCESWAQPECRNRRQKFDVRRGLFRYLSDDVLVGDSSHSNITSRDCREKCWRDCNCAGYDFDENRDSCQIWSAPNLKFVEDDKNEGHVALISDPASKKSKKHWNIWIIIAGSIAVLFFLCFGIVCHLKRRKQRLEKRKKNDQEKDDEYLRELMASGSPEALDNINEAGIDGSRGHDLKILSFASIVTATNDFSNENKLGQGGFGPVFKGKLVDGREIAVKRLSRTSGQGLVEFKNELILIAKLQHTNLVRVLGCCIHADEKMLIYEYMPNKSLDFFLFDKNKSVVLDWQKRVDIIDGIAQGLLYLHKYSRMRVIHRDLKASNVLLDENMNPKISDFGMARIFKPNETEAMTNRVVGTYGYMSPEYAMEGTFSVKSDVFSFGVLILEIVSGRKNNSFYHFDGPMNLVGYAWELWREGDASKLKDPLLEHSFAENQLLRTIHVGLLCVQESATDRPTMPDVTSMLSNETLTLPYPKRPAFITSTSANETSSSEAKSKEYSVNGASITVMEPR